MADFADWPRNKMSVTTLHLAPTNPRLPQASQNLTQNEIIAELVRHDNVLALAQKIATRGYFAFEPLVVVKEKSGTVVVEGNRRLAALKLLLNPDLASGRDVKKFKTLSERVDPSITKVEVVIAPNHTQAYPYIRSRHIGDGEVEKWTPIQQAKFYADRRDAGASINMIAQEDNVLVSEVLDLLRADKLYRLARSIELSESVRNKVQDPRKFPITTLTRLTDSADFRKVLGLEYDDQEIFRIKLAPDEFLKGFTRVVSDVARGNVTSRKHNTSKQIKDYVDSLGKDKPNARKRGDVTADDLIRSGVTSAKRKKKKAPKKKKVVVKLRRSVLPGDLRCTVPDDRIGDIFKELNGLIVVKYPNATAILLRSLLEMSCYRYLVDRKLEKAVKDRFTKTGSRPGTKWAPTLAQMLKYLHNEQTVPLDAHARRAVGQLASDKNSPLSVEGMHGFVHNKYLTPTERELRALMTRIKPILEIVLRPVD